MASHKKPRAYIFAAAMKEELEPMLNKILPDHAKRDMFAILDSLEQRKLPFWEFTGRFLTDEVVTVVFTLLGIGRTSAASRLSATIHRLKASLKVSEIARIYVGGSCAAYAKGYDEYPEVLAIGDVLQPLFTAYGDVDVTAFNYKYGQMAQQPEKFPLCTQNTFKEIGYVFSEQEKMRQNALKLEEEGQDVKIPFRLIRACDHNCVSISFDSFIADTDKLKESLDKIVSVEGIYGDIAINHPVFSVSIDMELIAVGQVCHDNNMADCLVVAKGISDLAGVNAATDFNSNLKIAAENSANILERLFQNSLLLAD
ncbi:5'-methylthioadenosine/S-adenosylhomocysteine nucleosidase [Ewingella americana]|uniref:Nucleoside phosphorylase domain-containing protein n=1 Tax=Ewingella americana TaxID=41202 RepID=A0A502GDM5_9GAMM|nr:5'-methylthioadenosine/S-adenosylhomocysteine nucleosidase [Ewingella americana]TPG59964.1 hypothetical protein EAH77_15470 [Ewingella americana]